MAEKTGLYPDAHPTAPGGMSQAALKVELVEEYGFAMADIRNVKWPVLIDMVVTERQAREVMEEAVAAIEHAASMNLNEVAVLVEDMRSIPETKEHNEMSTDDIEADLDGYDPDLDDLDPGIAAVYDVPSDQLHTIDPEARDLVTRADDDLDVEAELESIEAAQPKPLFLGMPDTLDFVFDGHAGAGPSGAERWMTCTASLGAARAFLETLTVNQQHSFAKANTAARQGTTAHSVGETKINAMLGRITPEEEDAALLELTLEPDDEAEAYDEEMDEYVSEYVDLVKQYADSGRQVLIEQRVEAAIPLMGSVLVQDYHVIAGSGDTIVLPSEEEKVLTVIDLKYGEGIDVEVEGNPQARTYALGALTLLADEEGNLPDLDRVELIICQPRKGGIKVWSESLDDLLDWRDTVLSPALTAALGGSEAGAVYVPSDKACQFCPARGTCAALAEQRIEEGAELFDVINEALSEGEEFPETGSLSDERLGSLLTQLVSLEGIKSDLKEEAQRRLHRGAEVPGFRLVNYTPPRKWKENATTDLDPAVYEGDYDEQPLTEAQAKVLWKSKLVTPKQAIEALKLFGIDHPEKIIGEMYDTPSIRPVISTGPGDKRKSWTGLPPEAMFADETGAE